MKIGKGRIAREIAIEEFIPNNLADDIVDAVFNKIIKYMSEGNTVSITGFGKFEPFEMKARKGRDIRTGGQVEIPARIYPRFSPGSAMKRAVIKEL